MCGRMAEERVGFSTKARKSRDSLDRIDDDPFVFAFLLARSFVGSGSGVDQLRKEQRRSQRTNRNWCRTRFDVFMSIFPSQAHLPLRPSLSVNEISLSVEDYVFGGRLKIQMKGRSKTPIRIGEVVPVRRFYLSHYSTECLFTAYLQISSIAYFKRKGSTRR